MRQLLILLKYGLKTSTRFSGKVRRFPNIVFMIVASLAFGLPIASMFFEMFKVLSNFPVGKYDLSTLLAAQWSLVSGLLFLASFTPSLVNSFVRNEELQLLLTFPIKRWTIVSYQMFLTLILQPLPIVLYVFVLPAYALSHGKNLFLGLMGAILFTLMLLSLSIIFSCLAGLILNRSTAKRLTVVSLVVTVVLFLMVSQFLPSYAKNLLNNDISSLNFSLRSLIHPLNPFGWPVRAIDEPSYMVFMLLFIFLFSFTAMLVSERLTFEQEGFTKTVKRTAISGGGMFWKDIKLFLRNEQSLFTLIYPVAFGIPFAIATRSFVPALLVVTIISGTYVSYSSAMLMKQELSCWPLPATFPVSELHLFMPKLFIPSIIYGTIFLGLLVFFQIWFSLPLSVYVFLPFVFILYGFASILGTFFYLKQPSRGEPTNPSRILSPTKVLTIQGIILLTSSACLLPISGLFQPLLREVFKSPFLVTVLTYALPVVSSVVMIVLMRKVFKRIEDLLRQIE